MTDLEREVSDSFKRIFPVPMVIADWDDVRDRAEAHRPDRATRLPSRRAVAIAAMIVVAGLLVAPALAIGDHILELIYGKSTPGDVQTPAWSPDGRKLAFVSRRDGNSEIYVMNADGSGLRNVTRAPSNDLDPAWSPDGRAIAFVRQIQKKCAPNSSDTPCNGVWRAIGHYYETYLYVVHGDGSGLRRLPTQGANPSWSADGKTIRLGRYLVHADGSGQTELPRKVPFAGAWSPDGKRIAFAVIDTSPGDRTDDAKAGLWVVNADGSNPRQLARYAAGNNPAWSPDGRRIAFGRFGPQWIRSAGPSADLYVVNADGSGLRRLTRHAENVPRSFAWSPDGRTIAFLHNREVYIVKADGSGERRLTQLNE
jgi:TolB protein